MVNAVHKQGSVIFYQNYIWLTPSGGYDQAANRLQSAAAPVVLVWTVICKGCLLASDRKEKFPACGFDAATKGESSLNT